MKLDDALEAADRRERETIESISVLKNVNTNFSLSGVRFGIATKRHPMPYDPANFTFSYSHLPTSHSHIAIHTITPQVRLQYMRMRITGKVA